MFTICKNFIKVNEDLYLVRRTFREETVTNVDLVKDWLGVPIVFRRDGLLWFCEKIEELETIN